MQWTLLVTFCLSLAACGGGSASHDPKAPFGPLDKTQRHQFAGTFPGMTATKYVSGVVGQKTINGKTWDLFKIAHDLPAGTRLGPDTKGTEVYGSGMGTDTITLAGFLGEKGFGGIVVTPLVVDLAPPIGKEITLSATGTVTTATDPVGKPATATATYSLVESNVAVTTPYLGTVSGCRHYKGKASADGEALPEFLRNVPVTGEVWYHPDFGIVAAKCPELGIDEGLLGTDGWDEPDSDGVVVGRMMKVLTDTEPEVEFSTFDRVGKLDANMCVHAKMLAEIRWANDADAKSRPLPDSASFRAEFNGGMGTFCWGGCPLTPSPVSIFHLEDNGKGYKFGYALISQALKNEYKGDGDRASMYAIHAVKSPGVPPIRVTARIVYTLATVEADCTIH